MQCIARLVLAVVFSYIFAVASPLHAITINLDYTYDTSNFFGAGNPSGAAAGTQARNSLEAAADYFSEILTDTFSSVQTPATYVGSAGTVTWYWQLDFTNPYTGSITTLADESIASDEYRIYVGARSLPSNKLGEAGPGGLAVLDPDINGAFTTGEWNQVLAIHNNFLEDVSTRGEASGFSSWGGAATFDNDGSSTWHYDHTTLPTAGTSDFYSVAIHELGHSLGLGVSGEWNALVSGAYFNGTSASSEFGGPVPIDCDGSCTGHWAEGTDSVIQGTSLSQEAAMDPDLTAGTRKRFTDLDAAALTDIGWSVSSPTFAPADYDYDGDVDDDDFTTFETWFAVNGNADTDNDGDTDGADFLNWQKNFTGPLSPAFSPLIVPEPNTALLILLGAGLLLRRRKL